MAILEEAVPQANRKLMWIEPDCSLTPMTRVRGGGAQCFSNDCDASACGLNLAGPFHGPDVTPEKLISENFDGDHPFYLLWSNGDVTNLSHFNGIYRNRILKVKSGLKVQWRPNPDNPEITLSFTIPIKRAPAVRKNNH